MLSWEEDGRLYVRGIWCQKGVITTNPSKLSHGAETTIFVWRLSAGKWWIVHYTSEKIRPRIHLRLYHRMEETRIRQVDWSSIIEKAWRSTPDQRVLSKNTVNSPDTRINITQCCVIRPSRERIASDRSTGCHSNQSLESRCGTWPGGYDGKRHFFFLPDSLHRHAS